MPDTDVAIIGGGIVGLAAAYRLTERWPGRRVLLLEKEDRVAPHQTGHNSGVLHSGIYYRPGSLRALNCREGKLAMEEFCTREEIPYEVCGKVIVAVDEREAALLDNIYARGQANGVKCELIDAHRLRELEPHCAGVRAIHVPEAGIVDYIAVCERLAAIVRQRHGSLEFRVRVEGVQRRGDEVVLATSRGAWTARYAINCTGLHSDRVARLAGQRPEALIVPFRGEYYQLRQNSEHLCRNLIYPTPDPSFPFLGVHFTRLIHGGVECGPNAVLAMAREGYRKTDVNLRDLAETLAFVGFRRLAWKYWRTGLGELHRSWSKGAFVRALQRLVPKLRAEHIEPAPAGVRAQAVAPEGMLVDDFVIERSERMVHVLNAPSPAATSALNIGRLIVDKLAEDVVWPHQ